MPSARRAAVLAAAFALAPGRALALFHLAHIDEVMVGYAGDQTAQYVEIRMTAALQNQVRNSVLRAFDCDGTNAVDLLVVPDNVPDASSGARWSMGTTSWATATGVTPDFIFPAGIFTPCGMVCWGAPGLVPPSNPNGWDHANLANYVDCVAYGDYTGPLQAGQSNPEAVGPGDGSMMSLQRLADTGDDLNDFDLAPATPTRNGPPPGATTTSTTPGATTTTTTLPGATTDQLLTGRRLVLRDAADAGRQRVSFQSTDRSLALPAQGSADDPTRGAASSLRLVGAAFGATYPLPTGGWSTIGRAGRNRGYRYVDRRGANGPLRSIELRAGKRLAGSGKGASLVLDLGTHPAPVGVVLQLGTRRYCMTFGGTATFKAGKRFSASNALAPAACPP